MFIYAKYLDNLIQGKLLNNKIMKVSMSICNEKMGGLHRLCLTVQI